VSERFVTLRELAELACRAIGKMRVPPVVPSFAAHALSAVTEMGARLTGRPPLVPRGQLHFLEWGAIPDASRAKRELGLELTPLEEGLAELVRSL
jgi:dihydroflavonol-4-reductase